MNTSCKRLDLSIDFRQLMSALSLALDLAETKKLEHAKRTTFIAATLAKKMEIPSETYYKIYFGSLLHDISKVSLIPEEYHHHSTKGAEIVSQLPMLASLTEPILYHHENWDGTGTPYGLQKGEIPLEAQIIRLADNIEYQVGYESFGFTDIQSYVSEQSGKFFSPELSKVFLEVCKDPTFFKALSSPSIQGYLSPLEPDYNFCLGFSDLIDIGQLFAKLIDSKSPFTASHSQEVANYAWKLSLAFGFDPAHVTYMRIAGILHDLGKVAIPSQILDKPGALSREEYHVIQTHVNYTELILSQVEGLEEIAAWSAMHHEKLDGTGYHRTLSEDSIPLEGRILAVADIFQALTEDRPYRRGMAPEQSFTILDQQVKEGKLDGDVVIKLKNSL